MVNGKRVYIAKVDMQWTTTQTLTENCEVNQKGFFFFFLRLIYYTSCVDYNII